MLGLKSAPQGWKMDPTGLEPPQGARNRRKAAVKCEETGISNSSRDPNFFAFASLPLLNTIFYLFAIMSFASRVGLGRISDLAGYKRLDCQISDRIISVQ